MLRNCGACGHKRMVQYQHYTLFLGHARRQQYGVSVCPNIPTDGSDAAVVNACFPALSSVELALYARAMAAQRPPDEAVEGVRT